MGWRIVIDPQDKRTPEEITRGGTTVEILPEGADEQEAVSALETWAVLLHATQRIPRSALDWQNEAEIAVLRRIGKKTYYVRVDTFEFETEDGFSNGYGYLRAVEDHA